MRKICALATRKFPSKEKKYVYNLYSRDTKEAGRKPGKKRGIFQLIELLQETLFLSCKLHTMPLACLYYQILIVETILYWILRGGWPRLQFGYFSWFVSEKDPTFPKITRSLCRRKDIVESYQWFLIVGLVCF